MIGLKGETAMSTPHYGTDPEGYTASFVAIGMRVRYRIAKGDPYDPYQLVWEGELANSPDIEVLMNPAPPLVLLEFLARLGIDYNSHLVPAPFP